MSDLTLLCRSCGLCCDGSLFGRVDLEPHEVVTARRHRLRVVASGTAFEQPCSALQAGSAGAERECVIYDERPAACRRFVCRLYERHRTEGGPLEARLERVRRVRTLAAALEQSGLRPADFEDADAADPRIAATMPMYVELVGCLELDFSRAR